MSFAGSLTRLPPRPIADILTQLLRSRAMGNPGGDGGLGPVLTLHLASGATLRGELLAFDPDARSSGMVVLQSNLGATAADVSYVPLALVAGLTVHIARDTVHVLAFGQINPQHAGKVPGRLEMERQFAEWSTKLRESLGVAVAHDVDYDGAGKDDQGRYSLSTLLTALQTEILAIVADDMGREALQKSLRRVRVARGDEPGVQLAGGTLVVSYVPVGDDIRAPEAGELRRLIEALL